MMKYLKLLNIGLAALALVFVVAGVAPTYAEEGSEPPRPTAEEKEQMRAQERQKKDEMREQRKKERAEKTEQRKQEVEQEIEDRTEKREVRREEVKVKKCQSRKQGLETKFARMVTNSQRINTKIDDILSKAVAYKESNNLQPENWGALVAAANQANDTSDASITNLQTVKPSIDCNNVSVSSDVSTFKQAVSQTRDDLKAYKSATRAVIKAMIGADKTEDSSSEGSNQ